jgi:hypothetical protein
MRTCRTSTKLGVSVAALFILGTTIVAVSQRESPPVTRVPVCIKADGQLRVVTDRNSSCGPSERQMDWVVGGEVTDVRVGQGLIGSREDGNISLALDPEIISGCTGCRGGRIFAGFNDGPGEVPTGDPPGEPQQIAKLDLPEGDYAILAKLQLSTPNEENFVACKLVAGTDSDAASVVLEDSTSEVGSFFGRASRQVMKLQVVHRFGAPGSVILSCADVVTVAGIGFGGTAQFRDLKIIAIEASHVSNVFLNAN